MVARTTTINGQPVGRFRASWLLFKEIWRFLRLDPEIMAIPLIAGILNILLFATLLGAAIVVHLTVLPLGTFAEVDGEMSFVADHPLVYFFVFLGYTIAAFTLAFSQGAIAHTVITRLRGGNASLGESLKMALRRWQALLAWSLITATVGLILHMLAKRFKFLGRLVISLIGVAWEVLTYFVAPAIIIENKGSIGAIKQSGRTLKQTFGETVMTNIGLGFAFFLIYLLAILATVGLLFVGFSSGSGTVLFVVFVAVFLLFLTIALLNAALQGVLKTLLYAYVMEHTTPPDFNSELLQNVLTSDAPTNTAQPQSVQSTV